MGGRRTDIRRLASAAVRTATQGSSVGLRRHPSPQPRRVPDGWVSGAGAVAPSAPVSAGGWLGNGRGLTAAGAVLVALLLGAAGAGFDVATGAGLRTAFAICFVLGCTAAAALVHHEHLMATLVMPPLLFVALAATASMLDGGGVAGSWVSRRLLDVVTSLVTDAPVLFVAVGVVLLVVLLRFVRYRVAVRRQRRAASVPRAPRRAPSA